MVTSNNAIKRLFIKLGGYSDDYLTADKALIQPAWRESRATKKTASPLKKEFQHDHINIMFVDRNMTLDMKKKMMIREIKAIQE